MPGKRYRNRVRKNLLVSTRPDGTRKYRKARVVQETTKPRGPKNIPFALDVDRDDYQLFERDSLQSQTDYYGSEAECHTRQFVFDPEAARKRSTVSMFDLLPVGDQQIINDDEYKRKKALRKARIQRLGGVRFASTTKTHDGLLPERKEAARFINRVLGQTGEIGQGYMKTSQNRWGKLIVNLNSWSPQIAWNAIPDDLKYRTAPLIVDFFRRWKDALAGNLTKTEVIQWGDLEVGKKAVLTTVPRGKLQILPGGGCDIALRPREGAHRLWVDKMANSITVRSLQRIAYPSTPGSILKTMAVYGRAAKTIQTAFRKWLKKRQFEAEMEEFRRGILREPATIRIQRWWKRWSHTPSGIDPRVRRRLLESEDTAEN